GPRVRRLLQEGVGRPRHRDRLRRRPRRIHLLHRPVDRHSQVAVERDARRVVRDAGAVMLTGRTVTKQLKIEARQYDLFGLDLGDGVVRTRAALGALALVLWIALSAPITFATGLIETRPDIGSLIILFPPIATIMLGFRDDDDVPQRQRITTFALSLRNL